MPNPKVSVIIPNYNYSRYISEAINSVLAQTVTDIELIVVDDGSTDGSKEILESYGTRIRAIFQQNQGVAAARNHGVRSSRGEYIAFLDADDFWFPEKIAKQIEVLAGDPELGLVHVGLVEIDGGGNRLAEKSDGMVGWVADDLLRLERSVILGGGSGFMVTREAFDAVGGFDCRLSTSADWDLFYQIGSRYQVGFVPDILLAYRIHGSNMHADIRAMEHDTLIGWGKAFDPAGAVPAALSKTKIYANLYRVLAASYFRNSDYTGFLRNFVKSICLRPSYLGYYLRSAFRTKARSQGPIY